MPEVLDIMKTVYIAMCADFIHHGHIRLIKEGTKYGSVVVGLLSDEAIMSYKRKPVLNYDQRLEIIRNIKGVDEIWMQHTLDYTENVEQLLPDYVIHAKTEDWVNGVQTHTRDKLKRTLAAYGGQLIEPEPTHGISSSQIIKELGL